MMLNHVSVRCAAILVIWCPLAVAALAGVAVSAVEGLSLTLAATSAAQRSQCDPVPSRFREEAPTEHRGRYENGVWKYSVAIPDSMTGRSPVLHAPQHGFGIVIEPAPQSYLVVDGSANSLEHKTARDAATVWIGYFREGEQTIRSRKVLDTYLDRLEAARAELRYACGSSEYEALGLFALSADRAVVYEITLYAVPERLPQDLGVFERVVKSWRYRGRR
jgi:hypothetical protein